MMAGVTLSPRDVQADLLKLIAQETIMIGHSLENDLNALKLLHMRSVDTALLYPHPNGPPFKPALRVLTERLLGRRIQAGSHDSVADAVATMELALLKFKKGPAFGEQRQEGTPVVEAMGEQGKRATLIDRPRALTRLTTGSASAVASTSDADTAAKAAKEARNPRVDFIWAVSCASTRLCISLCVCSPHLALGCVNTSTMRCTLANRPQSVLSRDVRSVSASCVFLTCLSAPLPAQHLADLSVLQDNRMQRDRRVASGEADAAVDPQEAAAAVERVLRSADAAVGTIADAMPAGSLLIVATGHGDTSLVRRLQARKGLCARCRCACRRCFFAQRRGCAAAFVSEEGPKYQQHLSIISSADAGLFAGDEVEEQPRPQ